MFWSALSLGPRFTMLPAAITPVAHSPYALIRHPLYAGYLLADFGLALAYGSWLVFAAWALSAFVFDWRARQEEQVLRAAFGTYGDYGARVRWRFMPFVR
jgi:protein-S-isoprenylcysteine O-methyltransferase Ste14